MKYFISTSALKICSLQGHYNSVHRTLCNVPEESRSHLLRGGSLNEITQILYFKIFKYILFD